MNIVDLLKDSNKVKEVLEKALNDKNKKLVKILIPIAKDPWLTYLYARMIVKGKIKDEWEDIIAQDLWCSYNYAYNVLKGPFPKGEKIFAKNNGYSYSYAKKILKGRFIEGEEVILSEEYWLNKYKVFLSKINKLKEFLKDHPEVKL